MKTSPSVLKQLSTLTENYTDSSDIFASPEEMKRFGQPVGSHGWLTQSDLEDDGPSEMISSEDAWHGMLKDLEYRLTNMPNLTDEQIAQLERIIAKLKKHSNAV